MRRSFACNAGRYIWVCFPDGMSLLQSVSNDICVIPPIASLSVLRPLLMPQARARFVENGRVGNRLPATVESTSGIRTEIARADGLSGSAELDELSILLEQLAKRAAVSAANPPGDEPGSEEIAHQRSA